jgi:hypothetical protein
MIAEGCNLHPRGVRRAVPSQGAEARITALEVALPLIERSFIRRGVPAFFSASSRVRLCCGLNPPIFRKSEYRSPCFSSSKKSRSAKYSTQHALDWQTRVSLSPPNEEKRGRDASHGQRMVAGGNSSLDQCTGCRRDFELRIPISLCRLH